MQRNIVCGYQSECQFWATAKRRFQGLYVLRLYYIPPDVIEHGWGKQNNRIRVGNISDIFFYTNNLFLR